MLLYDSNKCNYKLNDNRYNSHNNSIVSLRTFVKLFHRIHKIDMMTVNNILCIVQIHDIPELQYVHISN